jgi:homogentisate 1,2-dioxygenase
MAVMVDTFYPLQLTTIARSIDDPAYPYSWLE